MSMDRATVIAPATLSNLGSGFDVFGLALREPYDTIEAIRTEKKGVTIGKIEGWGADSITMDPMRNSACISAACVLERTGSDHGLEINIKKGIRPCSGIGSSGASAAGGAFAANLCVERPLSMKDVVICAAKAEQGTSGSFHADNVGPAVLGGFTIVKNYEPFEILRADPPKNLGVTVVMPDMLVNTKEARKVLPSAVPLKSMTYEVGNASALVLGMMNGDIDLIGRSMKDIVVEPARSPLVPHLMDAERTAMENGAAGAFLGGSGPCLISVFDMEKMDGGDIARAIKELYVSKGIDCRTWVTTWGEGCRRDRS